MTINKDLIKRLTNEEMGAFLRYCIDNNISDMDGFTLNDWDSRIYDLLYMGYR